MKIKDLFFRGVELIRTSFGVKFAVAFLVFIIIISGVFTAFFIYHQRNSLKENLAAEGELLAKVLAHNSRLGVFVENESLLKDAVEGTMRQGNVLMVGIYNPDGKPIKEEKRLKGKTKNFYDINDARKGEIIETITSSHRPVFISGAGFFEFWAPVLSGAAYTSEEELFWDDSLSRKKDRLLGFARVMLDKNILNQKIEALLWNSFMIALAALILGSAATFFLVKTMTGPLNKLTERVQAMEAGMSLQKVPVETSDEIGNLATAFNNMTDALQMGANEKQTLEEQLRQSQKMEAVGMLAGGIAHDFNNILTALIGFGNLLEIKLKEDKILGGYVEQILISANKAATLIQRLLAFSRKQVIAPLPVNLGDNIAGIEKLLNRLIGEDIAVKLNITERPLIVFADPGQLDQIIINLAANARDAMPKGGTLTISADVMEIDKELFIPPDCIKPGKYALLTVSDTGVGIAEKIKDKIFDPFFTTKGVGKGTGLGLSVVYGIVKQHNGYVHLESEPAKGTTFEIYLPLMDLRSEKTQRKTQILRRGNGETILFAEDDESVRKFVKETFREHGYRMVECVDGEDAVKKFAENKDAIDLVLMDMIMPGMSGKEAYDEIKKIKPGLKALFMSGYADDILQKKIILAEGINLIPKPIKPETLLEKIRETLDSKSFFYT